MKLASNRHCEACGPNTSSASGSSSSDASASSSRVGAALSHRSYPNDKARCKNDTTQGRTRERTTTRHRQRHRHRCVLSPPSRLPPSHSLPAPPLSRSFSFSLSLVTFAAHACRSSRGRLARLLLLLPTSLPPPPELPVCLSSLCALSSLGPLSLHFVLLPPFHADSGCVGSASCSLANSLLQIKVEVVVRMKECRHVLPLLLLRRCSCCCCCCCSTSSAVTVAAAAVAAVLLLRR